MDTNNIKFVGYAADSSFQRAYKHRENPMPLETFYGAVNQENTGGCSCCKQDVKLYCIYPVGIVQIKTQILSLCCECLKSLPKELEIINIDSNGCPPTLIYRWREV